MGKVDKSSSAGTKGIETIREGEEQQEEADGGGTAESKGKGEPKADDGDEEEDEGSSDSGTEIWECEDEDDFEQVMRTLGLEKVSITEGGDLKLPTGGVATHRELAYIFKQRNPRRNNQLAALPQAERRAGHTPPNHSALMPNRMPAGCSKIAMSRRQEFKEAKKVIAVLRAKSYWEMKMGMTNNLLQKRTRTKIRAGRGDMSGGR